MIDVSVIIPMYNAEKYIKECVESVLLQTKKEIEVICIDNNSSDNSVEIIKQYIKTDKRISIQACDKPNAGAARNCGLEKAKGEYVAFLDSDDFFDTTMIEKAYCCIQDSNADICIFDGKRYDNTTNESFEGKWLNSTAIANKSTICIKDTPLLLQCTNPAPWNKLFRKSFLENNNIEFQEIVWANDLYFTYSAMCLASCVCVLNQQLVYYRVNHGGNLQSKKERDVECFLEALLALKNKMIKEGIYDLTKKTIANTVINNLNYNLRVFAYDEEKTSEIIKLMKEKYVNEFDLLCWKESDFLKKNAYNKYAKEILGVDIEKYNKKINQLINSKSYKIGRAITKVPRSIKRMINEQNFNDNNRL